MVSIIMTSNIVSSTLIAIMIMIIMIMIMIIIIGAVTALMSAQEAIRMTQRINDKELDQFRHCD
jgi:Tfp pilus assembly protein PilO